ncbi:MAG: PAAR domain-containing protein [Holophagaceae bacterium]|nr:PAAR domain-containing protein [Holophagaceae bacterium]
MTADVQVSLTFPAGKSPKVFTRGWVFGARCLVNPGTKEQLDISDEVRWKGTGTFVPDHGPRSRPVFNAPGTNRITLYFEEEGKVVFEKTFTVEAVDPAGYARVTDKASCPADYHACPACPHPVIGPITSGSPTVFIDGYSAARVGDVGIHAPCCGKNQFVITQGDPAVLIDGKPAARRGDRTQHCGGVGKIIDAAKKR